MYNPILVCLKEKEYMPIKILVCKNEGNNCYVDVLLPENEKIRLAALYDIVCRDLEKDNQSYLHMRDRKRFYFSESTIDSIVQQFVRNYNFSPIPVYYVADCSDKNDGSQFKIDYLIKPTLQITQT